MNARFTSLVVLSLALTLCVSLPMTAANPAPLSAGIDFLLRAPAEEIGEIASRCGLQLVEELEMARDREGRSLYVVRAPFGTSPQQLMQMVADYEPDVAGMELASVAGLPEASYDTSPDSLDPLVELLDSEASSLFASKAENFGLRRIWEAYVWQPAAVLTEASAAQLLHFRGKSTVAIIDTGIDPAHPLFEGRLLPGYDFIEDRIGGSEWNSSLTQSTMAILGQSTMAILGDEEVVELQQSTMAILGEDQADQLSSDDVPPSFGHGTMVAGMIHRVAPESMLMPLRAFEASGYGTLADVIEAVYYAVDAGADVINMSFTMSEYSPELHAAIRYATEKGSICVSAVGNDGSSTTVYPAALPEVIGVASTSLWDVISDFSNFGSGQVTLSAPGEHLVTPFPGGGWAIAGGTSFAAPWVAGTIAVMKEREGWTGYPSVIDLSTVTEALSNADPVSGDAGFGRLDVKDSLESLYSGWW